MGDSDAFNAAFQRFVKRDFNQKDDGEFCHVVIVAKLYRIHGSNEI